MHEMRTIVIDDSGRLSAVTRLRFTKTAARIEVLFGMEVLGARKHCIRCVAEESERVVHCVV